MDNYLFYFILDFQKTTFWAPGGFGFFLGIFSLALGITLFVASCYFYKRYRQERTFAFKKNLEEENSYRIMPNTKSPA
jgi:hypothetical protein